jgi:hypothetical protein
MAQQITLKNQNGEIRNSAIGFSWTMLLFGFFPPLFRNDRKWALIVFLINLSTNFFIPGSVFVSGLFFGFAYNKLHLNDLMNLGFKPQVSDELLTFIYKYLNRNISDDTPISSFDSKSVSAFNAKTGGAAIFFLVGLIISTSTYINQPTFAFLGLVTMIGSGYVLYDEYRNK